MDTFQVSLETQKVTVTTALPQQAVTDALVKTGKATAFVGETA